MHHHDTRTNYCFCNIVSLMCTSSIHPQDDLHSQPLAYLYFLTVFESLLNQQNDLSVLLNAALEVRITCT